MDDNCFILSVASTIKTVANIWREFMESQENEEIIKRSKISKSTFLKVGMLKKKRVKRREKR